MADKNINRAEKKKALLAERKKVRQTLRVANNMHSKNHVSEKDLSPGGFPYHFAGPSKFGMNDKQKNERNRAKRARKELRAA